MLCAVIASAIGFGLAAVTQETSTTIRRRGSWTPTILLGMLALLFVVFTFIAVNFR
jgi:hypothetical protein